MTFGTGTFGSGTFGDPTPIVVPPPPPPPDQGPAVLNGGGSAVCAPLGMYADRLTYVTPDGHEYMLSAPTFVLEEDGYGMPPIEYVTERGPFQHGETVKDFFLRPRVLQLIVRKNGRNRAEYWNIRNTLLDILRPGRGVIQSPPNPGVLRKYLANGQVRELMVFTTEGPSFPSHSPDVWDQWSVQDSIRFTAYDPIFRDPRLQNQVLGAVAGGVLSPTFPITFPYSFAVASSGSGSTVVPYDGTWISYPTIYINGPVTAPLIVNQTTGEHIQFTFSIGAGHIGTVDLAYGRKTATLDDGANLIGGVTSDSDFATFHLTPGPNTIQLVNSGTSGASSTTLAWYNRYIGM